MNIESYMIQQTVVNYGHKISSHPYSDSLTAHLACFGLIHTGCHHCRYRAEIHIVCFANELDPRDFKVADVDMTLDHDLLIRRRRIA